MYIVTVYHRLVSFLRTEITSVSTPGVNCEDRTDSMLSDTSAAGAPLPVEKRSNGNAVPALGEVRGTTDGSASSAGVIPVQKFCQSEPVTR